jgi:hypothetical protein
MAHIRVMTLNNFNTIPEEDMAFPSDRWEMRADDRWTIETVPAAVAALLR